MTRIGPRSEVDIKKTESPDLDKALKISNGDKYE